MKDAGGHGSEAHGAHSAGVDQVGKYSTSNDVRDAHQGELYGSVQATLLASGKRVGNLDYGAYYNNGHREVGVKMIQTDPEHQHQHQGVATQMMNKLREEFTEDGVSPVVKWGMLTPEGSAFKRAYTGSKK